MWLGDCIIAQNGRVLKDVRRRGRRREQNGQKKNMIQGGARAALNLGKLAGIENAKVVWSVQWQEHGANGLGARVWSGLVSENTRNVREKKVHASKKPRYCGVLWW